MENDQQSTLREGVKFDEWKLRFDLIPADATEIEAEVWTYGAKKYEERNWEKGMGWSRLFAAALRHVYKFWRGEDFDQESGLPHLAHAVVCLKMLLAFWLRSDYTKEEWVICGTDDREGTQRKRKVLDEISSKETIKPLYRT